MLHALPTCISTKKIIEILKQCSSVGIVTGAASGIGQACSQILVDEGCTRLVLADISRGGLDETSRQLKEIEPNVETLLFVGDMSNDGDVEKMVEEAVVTFGAVHYCVRT